MHPYIKKIVEIVHARNHTEPIFLQALDEVLYSLDPIVAEHPEIEKLNILERLCEPERQIIFRVAWEDDKGKVRTTRGFRVEFSSALGPYKGGLRFHPTVNLGLVKFLGFEQVFKNSLTGLQIGGAKGGAEFNPRGCSSNEVMRFCQSFMNELFRHIGDRTDIPAGDIGVGSREIGFLFGQYKKLTNRFDLGVLTGKDSAFGGSFVRKEATGYGNIYFAQEMLATKGDSMKGKTCVVSGSGNVAIYCMKKIIELGGKVVACSDSNGYIYDKNGIEFNTVRMIKEIERRRIRRYAQIHTKAEYHDTGSIWNVPCDAAFPCATQNELDGKNARSLVKNGCRLVSEGANMPCTPDAIKAFLKAGILYGPGKAANAGGVAVSALEMQQNAAWDRWTFKEVDDKLQNVMKNIHGSCVHYAKAYNSPGNYVVGANIAGFLRVAQAMISHGLI